MAEEKDAVLEINKLLVTKPPVLFWGMLDGRMQLQSGPPIISAAHITEVQELTFGKPYDAGIPDLALVYRRTFRNCGDVSLVHTYKMGNTGSQSWKTTKTNGVTTTEEKQIAGSFSFTSVVGAGTGSTDTGALGGSISYKWTNAISTSSAVENFHQEATTKEESWTENFMPHAAVGVLITSVQRTIAVAYRATVVVDGEMRGTKPQPASSLLTKMERTFLVAGALQITDYSEGQYFSYNLHGEDGCGASTEGIIYFDHGQKDLSIKEANDLLRQLGARFGQSDQGERSHPLL